MKKDLTHIQLLFCFENGKKCCTCKQIQDKSFFTKFKRLPDGLNPCCKICVSIKGRKLRKEHTLKNTLIKIDLLYIKKCTMCQQKKEAKFFQKNRTIKDGLQNRCIDCCKIDYKKNKRKYLDRNNKYLRKRRLIDPSCKIRHRLSQRLRAIAKNKKSCSISKIIGCSSEMLKQHLSSRFTEGMSWENYGKWHVDHIKPCFSFNLNSLEEQRKCFHYTNLQPLWAKENLEKSFTDKKIYKVKINEN